MDIAANTAFPLAARGYASARGPTQPATTAAGEADTGFAGIATSFVDTLRQGEETARAVLTGGADPHTLVQALAASQLAVETAVTVRDKVVEAYQEILRMPV